MRYLLPRSLYLILCPVPRNLGGAAASHWRFDAFIDTSNIQESFSQSTGAIIKQRSNNTVARARTCSGNMETNKSSATSSTLTQDELPSHSQGVYFGGFQEAVHEASEKIPKPTKTEVIVKVHAVGLNPVDAKQVIGDKLSYDWKTMRRWAHNSMVKDTRVGFDFAGVVAQDDHPDFSKGTRVFGTMPPMKGSCSDYISAPNHQVAAASKRLSMEESAALPLVGLTAIQALSQHIVRDKSKVLVIGGSGGAGHVALQVAKALGAAELGTVCSTNNIEFVKHCGATHVVDYRQSNDVVGDLKPFGPFDVILDCVTSADPNDARHGYPSSVRNTPGLVTDDHLYQRLGGQSSDWIRASLARPKVFPHSWLWKDQRERLFWIRFPHSSHELDELTKMADAGQLRPKIQKVYAGLTADNVQQAFDDILSRRVQGKIVINVIGGT